jgi:hypothetical protein
MLKILLKKQQKLKNNANLVAKQHLSNDVKSYKSEHKRSSSIGFNFGLFR